MGGVLLGALVLYAAGAGPASYYETRYQNTSGAQGSPGLTTMTQEMYRPLEAGVEKTPLKGALGDYRQWWVQRAMKRYPPPLQTFVFGPYDDDPGICYEFRPDL
jgi:hypothetical protein